MFASVLVANRGEIARRVIRTLHASGIRSVAIYTDADAGAPHVREADAAVRVGSYLSIEDVIAAARRVRRAAPRLRLPVGERGAGARVRATRASSSSGRRRRRSS